MSDYRVDRPWSDAFIPAIKNIVGPLLLEESSFEIDTKQAADLVVLNARDKMIAARVRRSGYADRYPFEFTIRAKRDTGTRTELEKIVDGFGDWMFYGHAHEDGVSVSRWMVIDLSALRAALIRRQAPCQKQSNGDGTHFVAFDIRTLPKAVLIASSFIVERDGETANPHKEWVDDYGKTDAALEGGTP